MAKIFGMEKPDEPAGARTIYMSGLEHHATALGYFCMLFTILEHHLDVWFEPLLDCTDKERRVIVNASGQISNRCTLLRGLLFACPMPEKTDLREYGEECLNVLTRELIPLRNRLVHDQWFDSAPPTQWEQHARIGKTQSFQPRVLLDSTAHERTLESVWDAASFVSFVTSHLYQFRLEYRAWREKDLHGDIPPLLAQLRTIRPDRRPNASGGTEPPPGSSPA